MSESIPGCGLYKTSVALSAETSTVEADRLVYFHNHSDAGVPIVLVPKANVNNRWSFSAEGILLRDSALAQTLVALKPEGLWRLREHFHPDEQRVVPKNALVQLGYNRQAEPIVFFPKAIEGENGFVFPSRGTRIPPSIYALLEPLDARGPRKPTQIH